MAKRRVKDACGVYCIHEKTVNKIKRKMPDNSSLDNVSALFAALGNRTRVKIVFALSMETRLCVCDIANIAGLTVSAASHQLANLRNLKVVTRENEGNVVYYSLNDRYIRGLIAGALQR